MQQQATETPSCSITNPLVLSGGRVDVSDSVISVHTSQSFVLCNEDW